MFIGIGNDHHGLKVKHKLIDYLEKKGYQVINYGSNHVESVDYPDIAFEVGEAVSNHKVDRGILICMSGIGMSIAANKVSGVRCAKVSNARETKLTVMHNHANMIALSSEMPFYQIKDIVDSFLKTEYSLEERHQRRVDRIDHYHEL